MDLDNLVMKMGIGVFFLFDQVVCREMIARRIQYCSCPWPSLELTQHRTSCTLTPLVSRRSANLICFKVSIVFG